MGNFFRSILSSDPALALEHLAGIRRFDPPQPSGITPGNRYLPAIDSNDLQLQVNQGRFANTPTPAARLIPSSFATATPAPPSPTPVPTARPTPVVRGGKFSLPNYAASRSQTSQNWPSVIKQAHDILGQQGFAPAAVLGQLANESGRGTAPYTARNNFFNIGAYDNNPNNAYSYKSPAENIQAYANLIKTDPRYAKAYAARGNPAQYLQEIKKAGYASNPNYVQDITNTPEYKYYGGQ